MFVVSFRLRKGLLLALLCSVIFLVVLWQVIGQAAIPAVQQEPRLNLNGMDSNEARTRLLAQCGWQVDATPVEVCEITIPQEFDAVYESYNELQQKQGFDLSRYKGQRVKRWTYTVNNYTPEQQTTVYANLLVYKNKVIAGEIYSAALDGFMQGFVSETQTT